MSKQGLNGKQIDPIFIEVGAEGMPEGMTGQPLIPAKAAFMFMDVS